MSRNDNGINSHLVAAALRNLARAVEVRDPSGPDDVHTHISLYAAGAKSPVMVGAILSVPAMELLVQVVSDLAEQEEAKNKKPALTLVEPNTDYEVHEDTDLGQAIEELFVEAEQITPPDAELMAVLKDPYEPGALAAYAHQDDDRYLPDDEDGDQA